MCGAVVDVAASVVALPPPAAAAGRDGAAVPPHPAAAGGKGEQPQPLLLPYPAALRHNDCHYVYQVRLGYGK